MNGIIYAIGGAAITPQPLSTMEAYDPTTDTWTRKADMPTARFFFGATVVEEKIYTIGGSTGSPDQVLSTVEVYHPATDTWTRKTDMPTPRFSPATGALNGKIYAIVVALDMKFNQWSKFTTLHPISGRLE